MATGNARDLLTVQDLNPDPTASFTLFTDCRGHNAFNVGVEIRDNTPANYTSQTVATMPTIIDIDYSMFRGFPNR